MASAMARASCRCELRLERSRPSSGLVLKPISTRMAGRRAVVSTAYPACLTPRLSPECTGSREAWTSSAARADSRRYSLAWRSRRMKSSPPVDEPRGRRRLEADGVVFHARHAVRLLGLGLAEEVGVEPADAGVSRAARERVDVQRHEEVAVVGAVRPAIAQVDEGVGRARHADADALPEQFVAHRSAICRVTSFSVTPAGK